MSDKLDYVYRAECEGYVYKIRHLPAGGFDLEIDGNKVGWVQTKEDAMDSAAHHLESLDFGEEIYGQLLKAKNWKVSEYDPGMDDRQ